MKYRVVVTERAEADINATLRWFYDQRAMGAGERWFQQLSELLDGLESQPERFPLATEGQDFGINIRDALLGGKRYKHRILFTVDEKVVTVLRVWHSSRAGLTPDDLFDL